MALQRHSHTQTYPSHPTTFQVNMTTPFELDILIKAHKTIVKEFILPLAFSIAEQPPASILSQTKYNQARALIDQFDTGVRQLKEMMESGQVDHMRLFEKSRELMKQLQDGVEVLDRERAQAGRSIYTVLMWLDGNENAGKAIASVLYDFGLGDE